MKNKNYIEIIILALLHIISIVNCSVALINDYILHASDYLGLLGLGIVTAVFYFKPNRSFHSILILLILGLFNLLSFSYFFNYVIIFDRSELFTPGIQLISFFFLIILVVSRHQKIRKLYRDAFTTTNEERRQAQLNLRQMFKSRFVNLSDHEIDQKLHEDLVTEAKEALSEIKKERKDAPQHPV